MYSKIELIEYISTLREWKLLIGDFIFNYIHISILYLLLNDSMLFNMKYSINKTVESIGYN